MTQHRLSQAALAQFTGSETFYRHSLNLSVVFTEGVKYVADEGGAYWLLDKIVTNQISPNIKREEFQVWKLAVSNKKGVLTMEDGNGNAVYREGIEFTDFPLDGIELWFTSKTILLPSEY